MARLRIGVVGFSRSQFDHDEARARLREGVAAALARAGVRPADAELVSGLTNQGVPKLAYELAAELGMRTVGVSARRALRVRAGVYPVDERVIVGEDFGDESEAFLDRIDVLIRIGGGPQSRREAEAFRARLAERGAAPTELDACLVEREVTWYGAPPPASSAPPPATSRASAGRRSRPATSPRGRAPSRPRRRRSCPPPRARGRG